MMHCTFFDCVSKTRYVLPVAMHFVRALTKALNSVLYWISGTQTSFSEDASFKRSMVYMKWSLDHSFLPPTKQIGEIHSFLLGSSIQLVWCESKLWGSWNQKLVAVWVELGCLLRWCRTFSALSQAWSIASFMQVAAWSCFLPALAEAILDLMSCLACRWSMRSNHRP